MKVLHVIPSIAPIRGGPSQAVLEMVLALRQQGIDAEIATTNDNGAALLDVPLNQLTHYPIGQNTVPVRFFQRFSPAIAALREFAFSLQLTYWLSGHLAEYDQVHIHAIFSYPSTLAMTLARWQRVPYIVRPLGQLCHWSLQQRSRKKQVYLKVIEQANLSGSIALHFTSKQEQEEANLLGLGCSSFILPHGLNMPERIPDAQQQLRKILAIEDNAPIITFLSRLHPKKGLEQLISALGSLKHYPFHLVIAGDGSASYVVEINQHLAQNGLEHRTQCLGFVSGQQKDLLLQGSNLFALTSYSENFGIAVLEALAAGLPALVTPGVALSSVVAQHELGWVVEPRSEAIALALQELLTNPELLLFKGDRARQIVQQQFSWEHLAKTLSEHYQHFSPSSVSFDTL